MWTCPKCGEQHEDTFDSCWKCNDQPTPPTETITVEPLVSQTGGARLGEWFNASYPNASLSADNNAIQISCLGRDYIFPKSSINKLSRHRGIFSVGLRIEHQNAHIPEFIVFWASIFFWTSGFNNLKAQLENLGYLIDA
ncbi:MAG: hypothetical protein JWM16_1407 [Verrucomicrobiales bacterium]|nr:hypothetical protein [Verrucomicrobiales bacterium]